MLFIKEELMTVGTVTLPCQQKETQFKTGKNARTLIILWMDAN